jgi:glycosyltransferase involved in cell wall biosynthesis
VSGGSVTDGIDAAYLLLSQDDWTRGLRGNRWHWAKRWALHVPTVIVQPDQVGKLRPATTTAEPRIPNSRLLYVAHRCDDTLGLVQAAQIAADANEHGFQRPLLWSYNPEMATAFGAVAAAARVYHATENYFGFEDLNPDFLARLRASISAADLVVAVSRGVANGFEAHAEPKATVVVTNGVDYRDYAGALPDPSLRDLGRRFRRITIYAGNVNSRLDFDLLHECVRRFEDTLFAFYGRVTLPDPVEAAAWQELIGKANAVFLGEVPAERLPALYSAADVGIIPYRRDALLVESGFPLKMLEMGAAGLPVVSTHMKCVIGLAGALVVAETSEEFIRALDKRLDDGLTPDEREELERVCRHNDYDVKFEEVRAAIDARLTPAARRFRPRLTLARCKGVSSSRRMGGP